MIFFDVLTEMYTCHLLHLLGAEIPLTSLDQILLTFHLAYLSEGVSVRNTETKQKLHILPALLGPGRGPNRGCVTGGGLAT